MKRGASVNTSEKYIQYIYMYVLNVCTVCIYICLYELCSMSLTMQLAKQLTVHKDKDGSPFDKKE